MIINISWMKMNGSMIYNREELYRSGIRCGDVISGKQTHAKTQTTTHTEEGTKRRREEEEKRRREEKKKKRRRRR